MPNNRQVKLSGVTSSVTPERDTPSSRDTESLQEEEFGLPSSPPISYS